MTDAPNNAPDYAIDPKQIVTTGEEGSDVWNHGFGTWSCDEFGLDSVETVSKGERLYVRRDLYDQAIAERDELRDTTVVLGARIQDTEAELTVAYKSLAVITAERDYALAHPVVVKPLVWRATGRTKGDIEAMAGAGKYTIGNIHGTWQWLFEFITHDSQQSYTATPANSKKAAKASAQAHHEAQVRATLGDQYDT